MPRPYDDPSVEATYSLGDLSLPSSAGGCELLAELEGQDFDLNGFEQQLLISEGTLADCIRRSRRARCHWPPERLDSTDA